MLAVSPLGNFNLYHSALHFQVKLQAAALPKYIPIKVQLIRLYIQI